MKEASSSSPQSVKRDRFRISSTNETGAAPAKKMAYAEGDDVYCTLLMSESYLPGALVLAHSLRDAGTKKKLAVLVTLDSVGASTMSALDKVYDYIIPVNRIANKTPTKLVLMGRWDLQYAFTKINVWQQKRFRKIVYLDADTVVLRAPDELFDIAEPFAAAPDIGWPDCFNSGVMVLTPNMPDYYSLLALAERGVSFDGADQGLLNTHFKDHRRISFRYNCTPSAHYQYIPAYRHFESDISILHFIGRDKPWSSLTSTESRQRPRFGSIYDELLARWYAVYDRHFLAPVAAAAAAAAASDDEPQEQPRTGSTGHGSGHDGKGSNAQHNHLAAHNVGTSLSALSITEHSTNDPPSVVSPSPKRAFEAPRVSWDPARFAPPTDSLPEAANVPWRTVTMFQEPTPFVAPSNYPEPPKDLGGHAIPERKPETTPKQEIFPWEATARKATRVFAEDPPNQGRSGPGHTSPAVAPAPTPPPQPWSNYTLTNAWDQIPAIEHYTANILRRRRALDRALHGLPAEDAAPEGMEMRVRLTDFPSAVERPSLPVTPAAVPEPGSRTAGGGAEPDYFGAQASSTRQDEAGQGGRRDGHAVAGREQGQSSWMELAIKADRRRRRRQQRVMARREDERTRTS